MSIFEYDKEKHMRQIVEPERLDLAEKLVSKGVFSDIELLELTSISKEQLEEIKKQVAPKGITVIPSPIFEYDKEKHMKQIAAASAEKARIDFAGRMLEKGWFSESDIMELTTITKEQLDELKQQLSSSES